MLGHSSPGCRAVPRNLAAWWHVGVLHGEMAVWGWRAGRGSAWLQAGRWQYVPGTSLTRLALLRGVWEVLKPEST